MSFFQNFQKNLQAGLEEGLKEAQKLSSDFQPIATRTARQLQERFGQIDDISELPQEYVELERKVDTLKTVYQNLLSVTSTYENESYDYPSNLKESVNDITKTISTKVEKLASARSRDEAQAILIASNPNTQPKTLNHAISTSTNLSALKIQQTSSDDSFDSIAQGLTQIGQTETKIGEARLQQDALVSKHVNDQFRRQLRTNLQRSDKARKLVENKRLSYDAARTSLKNARPEKEASLRVTLETLEDEFAAATEEAVSVMKNVIENTSILSELTELITAQLAYHKAASELLGQLLPNIESLRDESGNKALSDVDDNEI
ncbi:Meiotically up-regulated protein [Wickerhamomyces ciferrii]|uniref:Meiotically up-regulated protein n=1 Tax=Wickerhamomyces ciferrii (strain ATCC 14091 / BCRC 22168 / CBS 111 / JCM 3599 / NBRC 0793 / NRRL Y-1031 F-60-10) TaxID=1206466 RepID=K0KLK8_WICCF|nr:Meiotically up-regulated protein [Wickerhamomyces ciferrii]CCH43102.1 Meiotically up-regulated protein [Wickerhamomyces ciferrii]